MGDPAVRMVLLTFVAWVAGSFVVACDVCAAEAIVWQVDRSGQVLSVAKDRSAWKALRIENRGEEPIEFPNLLLEGQLDRSDPAAIVRHVLDDDMSDAARALALHQYVVKNIRSWALPNPEGNGRPLQILGVYGYCNCGGFSHTLGRLAREAGMKARIVSLPGHAVTEIFYDGGWHLFDGSGDAVYRRPDGTVASAQQVHEDPRLLDSVQHRIHAPDGGFTEASIRAMYKSGPKGYALVASGKAVYPPVWSLYPDEAITWYRDDRAKFYPFQNIVFMSRPPKSYYAGGTLVYRPHIDGKRFAARWKLGTRDDDLAVSDGRLRVSQAGRIERLRMRWKLPWAVVGGRVRLAGFRTPDTGVIRMFLNRPDRRIQFVGVMTDQPDYDRAFDTVLHFDRAAVMPPPAQVLFDIDLEIALFKRNAESRLEIHSLAVEIDLQRSPQSLLPADLGDKPLVYTDKSEARRARIVLE